MSRLFITEREINFISDITKELSKDVIGQHIYYYSVNIARTTVHEIYEEAIKKVFDDPLKIECIAAWQPPEVRTNEFGTEEFSKIEIYIQARDMLDRKINLSEGDFFSFGSRFFEVASMLTDKIIYGHVERTTGWKLTGVQARESQFKAALFGPTSEFDGDADAVQTQFVQQRGQKYNQEGLTGDKRELQNNDTLTAPIQGAREVSHRADEGNGDNFYDE
jgi:hypothetical protein